ncbi:MAG: hypothetical protein HYR85_23995 [Planctomycetes bacterium]|nr:hypothetical protein [Planctomycetota bacterium]
MRYVIGLDLAKVEDYSVIVVLDREKKVVHVDRFNRIDWGLQIERIRATSERYNRAVVYCDTTGQGEPIYEALCKTGMYVEPYTFTSKSKAALVDNLAMMLEKRELTLPRADLCAELVDELESFEYSVTDNGNVRTGAPGGYHDDTVVALALGCWGVRAIQPMGVRFGVSYRARPPGLGNFGIFPPGW